MARFVRNDRLTDALMAQAFRRPGSLARCPPSATPSAPAAPSTTSALRELPKGTTSLARSRTHPAERLGTRSMQVNNERKHPF